jgi:hypothetical protein
MGMIRKTLSVGTLGMVSFRSKKERLRRAERSQRDAETFLQEEHAARVAAESRIAMAEKRVKQTRAEAAQASKRLAEAKRRNRKRKGDTAGAVLAGLEPLVRSGAESARSAGSEATERSRRVGRRARKAAKRSLRHAKETASSAKDAAAPHAERLVSRAGAAIEHLTEHESH